MSTTISTSYTAEDLLTMPDGDLYELVDGQLVERDMGTESNWIAGKLFRLIADYAESNGLGWGLPTDNSYQCFPGRPNQVRKPDVSFIRLGRLPNEKLPRGHCRIAPDLVAEVISPNDFYADVMRRSLRLLGGRRPADLGHRSRQSQRDGVSGRRNCGPTARTRSTYRRICADGFHLPNQRTFSAQAPVQKIPRPLPSKTDRRT